MTTDEFIRKQRNKVRRLEKKNDPFGRAVAAVHADQVKRIFQEGKKSNGQPIGSYDDQNPLYVNPKNAPQSFQPVGKTGRKGKTRYFSSYKRFRQAVGRSAQTVNLKLFGRLQSDFTNSLRSIGPIKWVSGTKNPKNTKKIRGAEQKYGRIFDLTKREKRKFKALLQRFYAQMMRR